MDNLIKIIVARAREFHAIIPVVCRKKIAEDMAGLLGEKDRKLEGKSTALELVMEQSLQKDNWLAEKDKQLDKEREDRQVTFNNGVEFAEKAAYKIMDRYKHEIKKLEKFYVSEYMGKVKSSYQDEIVKRDREIEELKKTIEEWNMANVFKLRAKIKDYEENYVHKDDVAEYINTAVEHSGNYIAKDNPFYKNIKAQLKSELIDIQIEELEGMKKKDKICKADKSGYSKDPIVYEAIRMENADNIIYNQALEDRIAKLLKQKGGVMKKYKIGYGNDINTGKNVYYISIWEGNMGLFFNNKSEVIKAIENLNKLSLEMVNKHGWEK